MRIGLILLIAFALLGATFLWLGRSEAPPLMPLDRPGELNPLPFQTGSAEAGQSLAALITAAFLAFGIPLLCLLRQGCSGTQRTAVVLIALIHGCAMITVFTALGDREPSWMGLPSSTARLLFVVTPTPLLLTLLWVVMTREPSGTPQKSVESKS